MEQQGTGIAEEFMTRRELREALAARAIPQEQEEKSISPSYSFKRKVAYGIRDRFNPCNWFYYDLKNLRERSLKIVDNFACVFYNKKASEHKRTDLISFGTSGLLALSNLIAGCYRLAALTYTLAPIPTVPVVTSKKFRGFVIKPLTTAFLLASAAHWGQIADDKMTYKEALRENRDMVVWSYYQMANFTENRVEQNKQAFFEQNNMLRTSYDYFDPATHDYTADPHGDLLRSFSLANYVSKEDNLDSWSRTQSAIIAYHASGVDPRIVASLFDREANGRDVVADNSTALGFAQYLDTSWLNSLYANRKQIIQFLNESGIAKESYYKSIVDTLLDLDRPAVKVIDTSKDPIFKAIAKNMSSKAVNKMTLHDFYVRKLKQIRTVKGTPDYKGTQLLNVLNWRTDNVMTGAVTGLDRMRESKGELALEKTKDMSKDQLLDLMGAEYAKHHLGLTKWMHFDRQLKSPTGRDTYPGDYTYIKDGRTIAPFKKSMASNKPVFYKKGDVNKPRTFSKLHDYYKMSVSRQLNTHFDRLSSPHEEISIESLIRAPEWVDSNHVETWKANILAENADKFRPKGRSGETLAYLSDKLPESYDELPKWVAVPLEASGKMISWLLDKPEVTQISPQQQDSHSNKIQAAKLVMR